MLFNTFQFVVFFLIVSTAYFLISQRLRWVWLLIASYYFYISFYSSAYFEYVFLLAASITAAYATGRLMELYPSKKWVFLLMSLAINLGMLFEYKYYNFFLQICEAVSGFFWRGNSVDYVDTFLPIGISFFTFQSISYSFDVYRGGIQPQRSPWPVALYISYFPQLVAGPIERAGSLIPQLYGTHAFDAQRVFDGLKIMVWGFFLKMVVADRLGVVVSRVYGDVSSYSGLPLVIATYFFAFQIYCDFAGYSIIALGAAKVMGIDLMENFKSPYTSPSIPEFWRRWNISLYTLIRDYLYLPLGGRGERGLAWMARLILMFFLSGLWHGANFTFVFWGVLNGLFYVLHYAVSRPLGRISELFLLSGFPRLHGFLKAVLTFHIILVGWVIFRSASISDAAYVFMNIFSGVNRGWNLEMLGVTYSSEIFVAIGSILFVIVVELLQGGNSVRNFLAHRSRTIRWGVIYTALFSTLIFGVYNEVPFIYFQF